MSKKLKLSKRQKLDAAYRAGQLCVWHSDLSYEQWKQELQELHKGQGFTNEDIRVAYRVANPRDPLFTQECRESYEAGFGSDSVKTYRRLQRLELKRHADLVNTRNKIVQAILNSKIVTETEHGLSTINPGILKILEIKHIDNSE